MPAPAWQRLEHVPTFRRKLRVLRQAALRVDPGSELIVFRNVVLPDVGVPLFSHELQQQTEPEVPARARLSNELRAERGKKTRADFSSTNYLDLRRQLARGSTLTDRLSQFVQLGGKHVVVSTE